MSVKRNGIRKTRREKLNPKNELHVNRTALIDADYLAYEAAAWAHSYQADAHDLTERVQGTLAEWQQRAFCSHAIATFSCARADNFRKDAYPLYKAHRTGDPPAMLGIAQQAIKDTLRSVTIDRLEADDIMGIIATNGKIENPVIVSVDKDMRQIPGWHLNPHKEDFPVFISVLDADYLFFQQWLTGDSTDGYGGIKGVGPAKAMKLLNAALSEYEVGVDEGMALVQPGPVLLQMAVMYAYRDAGLSRDTCIAQARCARILRASDWDAEAKAIIPWEPDPSTGDLWNTSKDG